MNDTVVTYLKKQQEQILPKYSRTAATYER